MRPIGFVVFLLAGSIASAHEPEDPCSLVPEGNLKCCDCWCEWGCFKPPSNPWSLQILTGYYTQVNGDSARTSFLPDGSPNGFVDFVYLPQAVRLEYFVCHHCMGSFWPSVSTSVLAEYSSSKIVRDFGSYLTGPTLLTRFTFSPEYWCHPYIQGGVGVLFTDADNDLSQRMIGGDVEFTVQAQAGMQFMINDQWSLDFEGGYQHISNAGTRSRNFGVNAVGGSVGLTYRFGAPGRRDPDRGSSDRDGSDHCASCR